MSRTLADMTPAEQDQCVGMWCDTPTITAVISSMRSTTKGTRVAIYRPGKALTVPFMTLELVTPRFDLPRAWTHDGTPVEMTQEHGAGWIEKDREPMHWPIPVDDCRVCETATPTHRRFVTDWEEA